MNSIITGISVGLTAYTFGMSAYGAYEMHCYSKGQLPVSSIGSSNTLNVSGSSQSSVNYHGNDSRSSKLQHGYEIFRNSDGNVFNRGISGEALIQNGSSPRANIQVSLLNKNAGSDVFSARIVASDIPGRQAALNWEINNTQRLWDLGYRLPNQIRPLPGGLRK